MIAPENIHSYCLNKPGATELLPANDQTLVIAVRSKIFILINLSQANTFIARCDPERAIALRSLFVEIQPAAYKNKKYWNTVYTDGRLTADQIYALIDDSYLLALKDLSRKAREQLSTTSADLPL